MLHTMIKLFANN